MSIEAIQLVSQAEATAQETTLAAHAQATQTIRDAERAGQLLLETRRQKAETETQAAMSRAAENAAARTTQVLADNAKSCKLLCSTAESHLDAAAGLILKRIVNV